VKTRLDHEVANRYEIDIVPNEHGGFHARVPDFPTIFTGGSTPEEAMRNALEAIDLMIEEYRDRELPVPEPLHSFSGQFNVRLPRALHRELVRHAESQGVSLNALVNFLLSQATSQETSKLAG
jgi:predicted RNase H-like HicB family nuclease